MSSDSATPPNVVWIARDFADFAARYQAVVEPLVGYGIRCTVIAGGDPVTIDGVEFRRAAFPAKASLVLDAGALLAPMQDLAASGCVGVLHCVDSRLARLLPAVCSLVDVDAVVASSDRLPLEVASSLPSLLPGRMRAAATGLEQRALLRWSSYVDVLLATTPDCLESASRRCAGVDVRDFVGETGVPDSVFEWRVRRTAAEDGQALVCWVPAQGSLRVRELVDAAEDVLRRRPGLVWNFVGALHRLAPESRRVEALAAGGRLRLVEATEPTPELFDCDLVVEAAGDALAPMFASALGVPAMVPGATAAAALVRDGDTGRHFDWADGGLQTAIVGYLASGESAGAGAMSDAARRYAELHFVRSVATRKLHRMYEELLDPEQAAARRDARGARRVRDLTQD